MVVVFAERNSELGLPSFIQNVNPKNGDSSPLALRPGGGVFSLFWLVTVSLYDDPAALYCQAAAGYGQTLPRTPQEPRNYLGSLQHAMPNSRPRSGRVPTRVWPTPAGP